MGVADRYEKRKRLEGFANVTSGGVENRRKAKNVQAVGEEISSRLSNLEKYTGEFLNSYKSRYTDEDGKFIDTYRADSQDWNSNVEKYKNSYDEESKYIKSLLDEYSGFFDKDTISSINEALDTNSKNYSDIYSQAKSDVDYFSKFKSEDDYNEALKSQKVYESKTTADLGVLKAEISELEKLKGMYDKSDFDSKRYGTPDATTKWNYVSGDRATVGNTTPNNPFNNTQSYVDEALNSGKNSQGEVEVPKEVLSKLGWNYINPSEYSPETIDEVIAEKRAYYNHAEYIQNGIKMASVANPESDLYDPEFELYAQKGKELGGGTPWYMFNTYMGDNEVEDVRGFYVDGGMSSGRSDRSNMILAMTDEEVSIYNYYLSKYGKEKAESYLGYLESTLNDRYARHLHENTDTKLESLFFASVAGLDQFKTGIENLLNTSDNYIPTSSYAQASAMIREDIVEDGKGWGVAYDLINTTSNMLPSILTSTVVSTINPVAGQVVGVGLLGASAAGNAYAEAINLGYTKEQARGYSILVGGSEAGLQYLLGGISKLGGSATKGLTAKIATKLASKFDKVFAKIAVTTGTKLVGNMVSEFGEEYLQEVLTPVFKNIALGTNEEVKFFTSDALYAGFLGALSAGLLEGGSIVSGEVGTYKAGKSVIESGQRNNLVKLGASMSADTVAHKIASQVNENTDAYTLGQLLREAGADSLSASNIADITAELTNRGMTLSDAQSIAKWLNKAVEGEVFTKSQKTALENNEVIDAVFRDVILNKDSSVNQRIQTYQDVIEGIEQGKTDTKAPSEKLSVLDETPISEDTTAKSIAPYSTEYIESVAKVYEEMGMPAEQAKSMAMAQLSNGGTNSSPTAENLAESKYEVSEDGKTSIIETGKAVEVKKIESISESGEANLTVDDGMVVKASDISFGSNVEAAFIGKISDIKIGNKRISAESANLLYHQAMTELKSNPDMSVSEANSLISGLAESYLHGVYNFGVERLTATDKNGRAIYYAGEISESQRKSAYKLGRKDSIADTEAKQKVIDDRKAKANPEAKQKHLGKVVFEEGANVDESALTPTQKANLDGIKLLAEVSNIEFHVFRSDKVGNTFKYTMANGIVRSANGWYVSGTNEIWVDINAGNTGEGTMIRTAAHEISHYIKEKSPKQWQAMADLLMETFAKNDVNIESMLNKQKNKIKKRYRANKEAMPSETELTSEAYEEFVSDALTDMLTDGSIVNFIAEVKAKDKNLAKRILDAIKNLLSKWGLVIDSYNGRELENAEAKALSQFEDTFKKLQEMYRDALMDADETVATIGTRNLADFADAKNTEGESLFQYRAMEADEDIYRDMLSKWGKMTDTQIDNLFTTVDRAMDIIKDNLEILDYAWEADIDDRAFSPVKSNTDRLYQVSLDFSTLCRKRILQQTIQAQLQEALNQPLSREEGIAIRDALMALQEEGRQIEIACALCYVESARMKSPAQIKKFWSNREYVIKNFFAGKAGGSTKAKIKQAEIDAREQLHKENPNGIKGKDGSMLGPRTSPLGKMSKKYSDPIRDAKRAARESYKPTAEEQRLINVAKGMTINDFVTPSGLENLAKNYPDLFDAYAGYIVNATHSKGIENDTWWRAGDSSNIGDVLIANMNKENGLRSQSWSDFQVIHILDYIASTIELSTRNAKEQAYSKVPDYVELMGQTGVMINMSLIPTRDFNGSLDYDSIEGMDYKRALELREKYPATAGTICIGIDNKQIQMLLADANIDYVIPYHKSGMAASIRKLMHIPTWSQYEDYQSEKNLSRKDAEAQAKKYGVTLLAETDPNYQKHTAFSEWFDLEVAKQIAKMENANPTDKAMQKKYGVMYGGYMAMQDAANNYLKLCAERGIAPKFSHENADFTSEANYWKLLIDRKMVNNATGEIIEQQAIKPIFDEGEVLRILNDELERYPSVKADQDYATRKVTEKFLSGEVKGGMSAEAIAKVMKTPVDNIAKTNIHSSLSEFNKPRRLTELDLSDYLKAGTRLNKAKQQALKDGKKIILITEDEITDYISASINGNKNLTTVAYGRVTDRLAADVEEYSQGDIIIDDNFLELVSYDIDHAYREHLKAKEQGDIDLTKEDFENIPEYIDNYDELVYAIRFKNGNTRICLSKKLANGRVLLIETVSKSRGSVEFKNMIGVSNEKYVNEYEKVYKKRNSTNTRGSESSNISLHDETVSERSITDFSDSVNTSDRESKNLFSERDLAPTFYSQMGKAVEGVKQEKLAANSVVNMLRGKGVKAEEIRWSGIVPFLEGKKSVTKQELLDFINGSMLQIGEQMSSNNIDLRYDGSTHTYSLYDENVNVVNTFTYNEFMGGYVSENDDEIYTNAVELEDALREEYGSMSSPRWEQYKLDGGTNYREIVFTLPNSTYTNRAMKVHWGQEAEGVLVHARIQDFDVNGNKMLFIEELQSDWHNEGHSKGYSTKEYEDAVESQDKLYNKYKKLDLAFHKYVRSNEFMTDPDDVRKKKSDWLRGKAETAQKKYLDAEKAVNSLKEKGAGDTPNAPFKDTYHEFVLKRLLRMAAEQGYDSIGWTPADIQSKRWSDEFAEGYRIEYDQEMPKFLKKYGRQWGAKVDTSFVPNSNGTNDFIAKRISTLEGYIKEHEDRLKSLDKDNSEAKYLREQISEHKKTIESFKEKVKGIEVWSMSIPDSMKDSVLYEGQVMYSERDPEASNRAILANSLESAAQNDIERNKLKQYKEKISLIEAEEKRLSEIQKQLFTKGAVEPENRKALQFEAKQISNRINTYDRQLLNLESTTALKNVLNREKALARKRQKQIDAEILKGYKEKAAKNVRELMQRNQESRKKATEGRNRTAMRHQIQKVVSELNTLLLKPSKERHVPEEMRIAVAEALKVVNMDTVGAEERIKVLNEKIAKTKDPDVIASLTETRDRILAQGNKLSEKLSKLKEAYEKARDSTDDSLSSVYDEVIYNKIGSVQNKIGKTPLRNMTLEQLESVCELYTAVLTLVRNSNKAFAEDLRMSRQALGSNTFIEIKENNKARDRIKHDFIEKFGWKNLKPMQAMKTIGSETLQKLWNNVLYGQEVFAKDYDEAVKFAKELKDKYGYKNWDLNKLYSFESKSGKPMRINLEQMMSIYAYSKRHQADEHIEYGGILLNESVIKEKNLLGKTVNVKVNDSTAYRLNKMQVGEIIATLEKEFPGAKDFVDEMQKYLSDTMGEKGNEVSMKMYGIRLFKEEHYFPLKSSKDFMEAANAKLKGDVKIKNKGMTKSTVEHARNPIVLENFLDVWGNHINEMALYHGLVLPLEDFSRTFNYSFKADENLNTDAESVKTALHDAFGDNAKKYIDELLKAINGGVLHDSSAEIADKMISKFKKAKVMASLSVIVQQPTAIIRAMGIIEPKYFVAQNFKHKATWEELKKYCPTAIIKETGSFDTNMGRTIVDMIKDDKGFTDKVGDFLGKAPAYMDEMGWNMIWRALKNKVATEQKLSGEALLEECGKQMTLILNETQVYDSVMARSEMMRSKNALTKMATAFMAEPTTVANMVYGAVLDAKRGKKGVAAKTVAAVISSVVVNGLVSAMVYALRDDDDDETLLEKYLSSATTEVLDGLNPLTYIPFVKDGYSIFQGYKVERADMSLIQDVYDAINGFYNVLDPEAYDGLSGNEIAKHIYDNSVPLLTSICDMFGLPVGNVLRDAKAVIVNDNLPLSQTSSEGTKYAFKEGLLNTLPKFIQKIIGTDTKQDKLYEAIINGDTAYVDRLKSGYKDDNAYQTAVRKALRENDPRIKEAAELKFGGDFDEYERLFEEIEAEGNFGFGTIKSAIDAEFNKLDDSKDDETSDDDVDADKAESIYKTSDINLAFENGDTSSALEIIDDIVKVKTENYINDGEKKQDAEKKAKSSVKSSMTSYWKPLYIEAYKSKDTEEMKRIRNILYSSGLYGRANEVVKTGQEWIKSSK